MTALLEVRGVGVSFGHVRALGSVSVDVPSGGLVLVLGLNGAGKTTFVRALAGSVPLRSGSVVLDGRDISALPAHRRVRAGISMVPEGRGVLPGLSVQDNLDLGWRSAPRERRESKKQAQERALDLFPALAPRLAQDCSTLSGGEMQMLAIARSLLARPRVILLDEPSLGLAPKITASVYEAVEKLTRDGLTAVVVEQKAVPLATAPNTVLVLRNGDVVHTMHDARPTHEELAGLYLSDAPIGGAA